MVTLDIYLIRTAHELTNNSCALKICFLRSDNLKDHLKMQCSYARSRRRSGTLTSRLLEFTAALLTDRIMLGTKPPHNFQGWSGLVECTSAIWSLGQQINRRTKSAGTISYVWLKRLRTGSTAHVGFRKWPPRSPYLMGSQCRIVVRGPAARI